MRPTVADLHHSAEMVLCFRIHILLFSLFPSQSLSSGQRQPAYGVKRTRVPSVIFLVQRAASKTDTDLAHCNR